MAPSILIVDDLPNWRRQLSAVLARYGYTAEAVCTAAEARTALASGQFRLAVIDIRLVDGDDSNVEGLELLEEIDRAGLDLKVIIMTGYGTAQQEKRARKSPRCVGFIKKEEFDIRQFVAAVETSVGAPE